MTRSRISTALLALAIVGLVVPAFSGAATKQLSAKLKGSEEPAGGDKNGKGEAFVGVRDVRKGKLCFQITWEKIEPPTAAHIHKGAKGVDGPIKVTLFEDASGVPGDTVESCVKGIRERVAKQLRKTPEKFYVNVHNAEFPGGAIRGQLGLAL